MAHKRIGDWRQAIAAIKTSEAVAPGRFTAANFLILAMAHWQLGETKNARLDHQKAVGSMEQGSQSPAAVLAPPQPPELAAGRFF
jgi:hypothetical protein